MPGWAVFLVTLLYYSAGSVLGLCLLGAAELAGRNYPAWSMEWRIETARGVVIGFFPISLVAAGITFLSLWLIRRSTARPEGRWSVGLAIPLVVLPVLASGFLGLFALVGFVILTPPLIFASRPARGKPADRGRSGSKPEAPSLDDLA